MRNIWWLHFGAGQEENYFVLFLNKKNKIKKVLNQKNNRGRLHRGEKEEKEKNIFSPRDFRNTQKIRPAEYIF